MNSDIEIKVLNDKLIRQELLNNELRKQNKELSKIVRELNEFIGKLTGGEKFPEGTLGNIANKVMDKYNATF